MHRSQSELTLMGSTWRAVNSRSSRAATCEKHSGQGAVRLKLSPPCVTCTAGTPAQTSQDSLISAEGAAQGVCATTSGHLVIGAAILLLGAGRQCMWVHLAPAAQQVLPDNIQMSDVLTCNMLCGPHQVLHDGREREDMAAGRDLRRDRRPQRDGARHLPSRLHVHLRRPPG